MLEEADDLVTSVARTCARLDKVAAGALSPTKTDNGAAEAVEKDDEEDNERYFSEIDDDREVGDFYSQHAHDVSYLGLNGGSAHPLKY